MTRRKADAARTVSVRLYADELAELLRWAPPPTDGRHTRGVTEALRCILAAVRDMEPTVSMTPRYVRTACLAGDIAPTVYAADADGMPTRLLDASDTVSAGSIVWVMRRG